VCLAHGIIRFVDDSFLTRKVRVIDIVSIGGLGGLTALDRKLVVGSIAHVKKN
jgi:hypothetical protein